MTPTESVSTAIFLCAKMETVGQRYMVSSFRDQLPQPMPPVELLRLLSNKLRQILSLSQLDV